MLPLLLYCLPAAALCEHLQLEADAEPALRQLECSAPPLLILLQLTHPFGTGKKAGS